MNSTAKYFTMQRKMHARCRQITAKKFKTLTVLKTVGWLLKSQDKQL